MGPLRCCANVARATARQVGSLTRLVQTESRTRGVTSVARQLHVELVAVEEKVWSGDADMVMARTTEGELGVLPGHTPLLGQLAQPGQVRIKQPGGQELAFDVDGGFLSVTGDAVTVLAESATPTAPQTSH